MIAWVIITQVTSCKNPLGLRRSGVSPPTVPLFRIKILSERMTMCPVREDLRFLAPVGRHVSRYFSKSN